MIEPWHEGSLIEQFLNTIVDWVDGNGDIDAVRIQLRRAPPYMFSFRTRKSLMHGVRPRNVL